MSPEKGDTIPLLSAAAGPNELVAHPRNASRPEAIPFAFLPYGKGCAESQPPVVVPLAVEDSFSGVFEKFVEPFPEKFGLFPFDLDGVNPHTPV